MTRMTPPKPTPRYVVEYRVRFFSVWSGKKFETTAVPGIIKGSRPKAERALARMQEQREAWLEVKYTKEGEWERA